MDMNRYNSGGENKASHRAGESFYGSNGPPPSYRKSRELRDDNGESYHPWPPHPPASMAVGRYPVHPGEYRAYVVPPNRPDVRYIERPSMKVYNSPEYKNSNPYFSGSSYAPADVSKHKPISLPVYNSTLKKEPSDSKDVKPNGVMGSDPKGMTDSDKAKDQKYKESVKTGSTDKQNHSNGEKKTESVNKNASQMKKGVENECEVHMSYYSMTRKGSQSSYPSGEAFRASHPPSYMHPGMHVDMERPPMFSSSGMMYSKNEVPSDLPHYRGFPPNENVSSLYRRTMNDHSSSLGSHQHPLPGKSDFRAMPGSFYPHRNSSNGEPQWNPVYSHGYGHRYPDPYRHPYPGHYHWERQQQMPRDFQSNIHPGSQRGMRNEDPHLMYKREASSSFNEEKEISDKKKSDDDTKKEDDDSDEVIHSKKRKSQSSTYRGVSLHKRYKSKPYVARVWLNHKSQHLGVFTSEEEAARAVDKKLIEIHGEDYDKLNFPTSKNKKNEGAS